MVEVVKNCTKLEVLEIAGTNVAILPGKLSDLIIVSDTTPLAQAGPKPGEIIFFCNVLPVLCFFSLFLFVSLSQVIRDVLHSLSAE